MLLIKTLNRLQALGRRIIQIYYNNADSINVALDRSPTLKAFTRRVFEIIALWVDKIALAERTNAV